MVVHMRHTRAHTGNRRSHHALGNARLSKCVSCQASYISHTVCQNCGKYNGRQVLHIAKKAEKMAKKAKAMAEQNKKT